MYPSGKKYISVLKEPENEKTKSIKDNLMKLAIQGRKEKLEKSE